MKNLDFLKNSSRRKFLKILGVSLAGSLGYGLLNLHESQINKFKEHGFNMLDNVTTLAKFRGNQCSLKYAEAFNVLKLVFKQRIKFSSSGYSKKTRRYICSSRKIT